MILFLAKMFVGVNLASVQICLQSKKLNWHVFESCYKNKLIVLLLGIVNMIKAQRFGFPTMLINNSNSINSNSYNSINNTATETANKLIELHHYQMNSLNFTNNELFL